MDIASAAIASFGIVGTVAGLIMLVILIVYIINGIFGHRKRYDSDSVDPFDPHRDD